MIDLANITVRVSISWSFVHVNQVCIAHTDWILKMNKCIMFRHSDVCGIIWKSIYYSMYDKFLHDYEYFSIRWNDLFISITFHIKDTFWQYRLQVQTHSCTTDTSLDDSYNRMIPGKVIQIFCTFLAFSYHNIALRRSIKTLNSIQSLVLPWIK